MNSLWYRALRLSERLVTNRSDSVDDKKNRSRAERILAEWRAQSPFQDEEWFRRRLALDGIDEATLRSLLMEPVEALQERCGESPAWMGRLLAEFDPGGEAPEKTDLPAWSPAFVFLV